MTGKIKEDDKQKEIEECWNTTYNIRVENNCIALLVTRVHRCSYRTPQDTNSAVQIILSFKELSKSINNKTNKEVNSSIRVSLRL